MSPYSSDAECDLFIVKMKKAGVIKSAVFSMSINLRGDDSKMTLGGYDEIKYAMAGEQVFFHNITKNKFHWMLTLESMSLHGDPTKTYFG